METARDFSTSERQKLAKSGAALPDGSFPIASREDLMNAIHAFGRAGNKARAKAHIIKRARALGLTKLLPEGWSGSTKEESLWEIRHRLMGRADRHIPEKRIVPKERAFYKEQIVPTVLVDNPTNGHLYVTAWAREVASDNPTHLRVQGRFVESERPNLKGVVFRTKALESAHQSVVNGPLNVMHQDRAVVGTITSSKLVPSQPPHVEIEASVWKWLVDSSKIEAAMADKQAFLSMEAIGESVSCLSPGCNQTYDFASVYERGESCEHLAARSGNRQINNPIFLGGALVLSPAKPAWPQAALWSQEQYPALEAAVLDGWGVERD